MDRRSFLSCIAGFLASLGLVRPRPKKKPRFIVRFDGEPIFSKKFLDAEAKLKSESK